MDNQVQAIEITIKKFSLFIHYTTFMKSLLGKHISQLALYIYATVKIIVTTVSKNMSHVGKYCI